MNFQEERRNVIQELKQAKHDQVSKDLLLLENAELKEQWLGYKESWEEFQEYVKKMLSELQKMTDGRLDMLEDSNNMLRSNLDEKLRTFTGKLDTAADSATKYMGAAMSNMQKAVKASVTEIEKGTRNAHELNDHYWHSRNLRNIGVVLYLAITPTIILLDFLSRYFGWF